MLCRHAPACTCPCSFWLPRLENQSDSLPLSTGVRAAADLVCRVVGVSSVGGRLRSPVIVTCQPSSAVERRGRRTSTVVGRWSSVVGRTGLAIVGQSASPSHRRLASCGESAHRHHVAHAGSSCLSATMHTAGRRTNVATQDSRRRCFTQQREHQHDVAQARRETRRRAPCRARREGRPGSTGPGSPQWPLNVRMWMDIAGVGAMLCSGSGACLADARPNPRESCVPNRRPPGQSSHGLASRRRASSP